MGATQTTEEREILNPQRWELPSSAKDEGQMTNKIILLALISYVA